MRCFKPGPPFIFPKFSNFIYRVSLKMIQLNFLKLLDPILSTVLINGTYIDRNKTKGNSIKKLIFKLEEKKTVYTKRHPFIILEWVKMIFV